MKFHKTYAFLSALAVFIAGCISAKMPGRSFEGPQPPLDSQELRLANRLKRHVYLLAGQIGARSLSKRPEALAQAAGYIRRELRGLGYQVKEQAFQVEDATTVNLEVEIKGIKRPDEILVIGAHYDSVHEIPGADDNASAVAAGLELARMFKQVKPERTLRFVFFTNEEPPYFRTDNMGSRVYANRCRERRENVVGMLALEMLGYYDDTRHSQHFMFPFGILFPRAGNFLLFVGNPASADLLGRSVYVFRRTTPFPAYGAMAPAWIPGVDFSDHQAFWRLDYPAVMVTDTAFNRNPNYHKPTDTPETLDYQRCARVTAGLARVIRELSRD